MRSSGGPSTQVWRDLGVYVEEEFFGGGVRGESQPVWKDKGGALIGGTIKSGRRGGACWGGVYVCVFRGGGYREGEEGSGWSWA
jgi:hypothetical protein